MNPNNFQVPLNRGAARFVLIEFSDSTTSYLLSLDDIQFVKFTKDIIDGQEFAEVNLGDRTITIAMSKEEFINALASLGVSA